MGSFSVLFSYTSFKRYRMNRSHSWIEAISNLDSKLLIIKVFPSDANDLKDGPFLPRKQYFSWILQCFAVLTFLVCNNISKSVQMGKQEYQRHQEGTNCHWQNRLKIDFLLHFLKIEIANQYFIWKVLFLLLKLVDKKLKSL